MSWIIFASISPFIWAIYNIMDQYLARKYFCAAGLMMVVFSSLIGFWLGVIILCLYPPCFDVPFYTILALSMLGTTSIFIFWPYIIAIQEDDSNVAVPIFQTIPVFVFALGWLFLDEVVSMQALIASMIIVCAAIGMSFDMEGRCFRRKTLGCMLLSSFGMALYTVALRYFAEDIHWLVIIGWNLIGAGICAFIMTIFIKNYRQNVACLVTKLPIIIFLLFVSAELMAILAEMSFTKALAIAPSAGHVQTMNGLQPFFLMVLGVFAYRYFPKWFTRTQMNKSLAWRVLCLVAIFIGIYLLGETSSWAHPSEMKH